MAESSGSSVDSASRKTSTGLGLRTTIKLIRAKYPKVKDITTETLEQWLQEGADNPHVALMDCRDVSEYSVSHLSGAQQVDWEHGDPQQLLTSVPHDKPVRIVCYCSVGYRSAAMADKIQKHLKSSGKDTHPDPQDIQVYNLEGSIFKWANEGRSMVKPDGQPTPLCHPYNMVWGKMLDKDLRFSGPQSGE